jgi:hypothetical protein
MYNIISYKNVNASNRLGVDLMKILGLVSLPALTLDITTLYR